MRNKLNMPLMARHPMLRWLVGIGLWLIVSATFAQPFDKENAPRILPKGTVSLEYPNEWDINKQIALSNDGSRLIDAAERGRYIRVWDWEKKEVVQRLLLNEQAPEMNDGKQSRGMVLQSSRGQELALSPDGRKAAACVNIDKQSTFDDHVSIRVWNLESGAVMADIPSYQRHVFGMDQDALVGTGCKSISYSPDGKHLAVLVSGMQFVNEAGFADYKNYLGLYSDFDPRTRKFKSGMTFEQIKALEKHRPTGITGIALFETSNWKLERFFYRPQPQQLFNSRPLFDAESKTVSAVLFDRPPITPNAGSSWNRQWVGNRIVRWDIASGAQLEERDMPQLANSPENGVWWTPLHGGREVWWQDMNIWWGQTAKEVEQCIQNPPSTAIFVSDEKITCADEWLLTILNLDTGKIRYLAPVKKNKLRINGTQDFHWANISPDGAHIVIFHTAENTRNPLQASSSVEVRNMETGQLEGRYSDNTRFVRESVFSSDSRYFAFPINKSRDWVKSAVIFELPKKK